MRLLLFLLLLTVIHYIPKQSYIYTCYRIVYMQLITSSVYSHYNHKPTMLLRTYKHFNATHIPMYVMLIIAT